MFYFEVSLYSILPPEEAGMNFKTELGIVWYRSKWFYAMVMSVFFFFYFALKSATDNNF
jgi:hypothetical protein